ncbi:UNKNOWN [Stylonychia lemnae]|uniref:Uncharacterized protein n=1 Tax=Stylonychia lemnae TaxID=5949 RepID=A0A078B846_STYLE|nr:UNKNOWN [Stylonychia lemnae]|eukprot:CDW89457.1 UNKNOWN [Stylonychia lemnae]
MFTQSPKVKQKTVANNQGLGSNPNFINNSEGDYLVSQSQLMSNIESNSNFNGTAQFGQGTVLSMSEYNYNQNPTTLNLQSTLNLNNNFNVNVTVPQNIQEAAFFSNNNVIQVQQLNNNQTPKFNSLMHNKPAENQNTVTDQVSERAFSIVNNTLNNLTSPNRSEQLLESVQTKRQFMDKKNNNLFTVQQLSECEEENIEDTIEPVLSMDANINILMGSHFKPSQKKSNSEIEFPEEQKPFQNL